MDTSNQSASELIELAREDISRNRLSSAEQTLGQAILINNQMADAFHLLGYVYFKKEKFKKAILAFERALKLDPLHTEAAIALSSLYNDMGKYREGAAIFFKTKKRLERSAPGHDPRINYTLAKKHNDLGMSYLRYERFEEAYVEFKKAADLEPSNEDYRVRVASCQSKVGNIDAAIETLSEILRTHPKNVECRIQLGVLYHSKGELKGAHDIWFEALALDPENKDVQMYLSMLGEDPSRLGPLSHTTA